MAKRRVAFDRRFFDSVLGVQDGLGFDVACASFCSLLLNVWLMSHAVVLRLEEEDCLVDVDGRPCGAPALSDGYASVCKEGHLVLGNLMELQSGPYQVLFAYLLVVMKNAIENLAPPEVSVSPGAREGKA